MLDCTSRLLFSISPFLFSSSDFFEKIPFLLPKMERSESLSSLTYKGSIPEAILEAKTQKKLFVVYISGEDDESKNLEDSTWTDVKESLSKYCILVHIRGGSNDASNFSAIYPQKSVPCITAIGYNGVQVWQSEGFVSAEVLASSLEKALLSLHFQETTATVLSAALASKKYESSSSGASTVSHFDQGNCSNSSVPSTTMDEVVQSLEFGGIEENGDNENTVKERNPELVDKSRSESFNNDNSANVVDEQCDVSNEATRTVVSSVSLHPAVPVSENTSSRPEDDCIIPVKGIDDRSSFPSGSSPVRTAVAEKAMQREKDKVLDDKQDGASESTATANIPTDVHLNIRLPDNSSLQEKFPVAYTLRRIKDYVDRNQSTGMGSYDLAIPYPRKVFGDQDLSKSLLDLGLLNRQALIVVPHQRSTGFQGQRSLADQRNSPPTEDSAGSNGGYFAYIKSFLSYVNPFSYLGGSTSSSTTAQESQSGIWEYGPNPTLQNNLAGRNRTHSPNLPNRSTSTARDDSRNRRPTTTQYGSNIHTLKHDEDDGRFNDRNPFWNGNSTQYGGNSDSK
ncbi:plant UBX domain-containing protein 11 isoform X2 [Durio zibethinus]|uniref:Plant UBX domain-containing protein 11 isoform X2 n=1 Tax=Durio zibethinus TaxID=66656 RepID=A0A6P6AA46_DURZI|nr:plant UBX domain-containing protein 11 isoform X2 [Durio zibethinus]